MTDNVYTRVREWAAALTGAAPHEVVSVEFGESAFSDPRHAVIIVTTSSGARTERDISGLSVGDLVHEFAVRRAPRADAAGLETLRKRADADLRDKRRAYVLARTESAQAEERLRRATERVEALERRQREIHARTEGL